MKTLAEIRPIKEVREADFLKLPGVTGVDIGYKYVGGEKTDELAIRVYVAEKKDPKEIPSTEQIPKTTHRIKTDVIQRKFVLHPLRVRIQDLRVMADTGNYDPLRGGISIGPCRSFWLEPPEVEEAGWYVFTGTLGCIVNDNQSGDPLLLSNFHVMCVDDAWSVGDTMAQPSLVDTGHCPADVVGELQRAVLAGSTSGGGPGVDCAVASHTARGHACEIVDIGDVAGTAMAAEGLAVRKRGRTTGLTYGTVDTVDLTAVLDYGNGLGTVFLKKQIQVEVDLSQSTEFGLGGDSGSVVVNDAGEVVGLYFAGNVEGEDEHGIYRPEGYWGIANPIQAVLEALDVSICVPKDKEVKLEKFEKWEQKELKWEKWEHKEFKWEKLEKFEKLELEGFPFQAAGPAQPSAGATPEERLAQLEAAVAQMRHFISPELRPDLGRGALKREPDLG